MQPDTGKPLELHFKRGRNKTIKTEGVLRTGGLEPKFADACFIDLKFI
jgi:hypothetical protein